MLTRSESNSMLQTYIPNCLDSQIEYQLGMELPPANAKQHIWVFLHFLFTLWLNCTNENLPVDFNDLFEMISLLDPLITHMEMYELLYDDIMEQMTIESRLPGYTNKYITFLKLIRGIVLVSLNSFIPCTYLSGTAEPGISWVCTHAT